MAPVSIRMQVDNSEQLEPYLHEHIPLSRHLGARVLEATPQRVRLHAPLAPNLNHRQTAFGGSLAALAILAGWGMLWVRLRELTVGPRIVIHSNSLSYLAPAEEDFEATCLTPASEAWSRFLRTLTQRGRARIELHVQVHAQDELVAEFSGKYVVLRPDVEA